MKVTHRDVLDVVCAAVIGRQDRPSAIVAGPPMHGRLWIVGRSTPLGATASKPLAAYVHVPRADHPWPEEVSPGLLDRFTTDKEPIHLTRVEPRVVEVSADVAWSGRSFRHPLGLLRARPELNPDEVQLPEHLTRVDAETRFSRSRHRSCAPLGRCQGTNLPILQANHGGSACAIT